MVKNLNNISYLDNILCHRVECFCGNQQLTEFDKAPDSECNFGCTGDYSKKCGGNWRNTIYSTGYTLQGIF